MNEKKKLNEKINPSYINLAEEQIIILEGLLGRKLTSLEVIQMIKYAKKFENGEKLGGGKK